MSVNMIRCLADYATIFLFIIITISETAFGELYISFDIQGEGFHQNLHISGRSQANSNCCQYLLKWTIPAGVYADPYQLQLSILNKTLHFTDDVNVESMAHNSPEIVFYTVEKPVFLEVCEFSKSIPVHARYHSPSMKHSSSDLSALVNLVPPLVYSSCNSKDSCFDENEPSCEWEKMNLSPSLSRTQMSVPVGDLSHSRIVAAVTLLTTIVGTVFLAKEI